MIFDTFTPEELAEWEEYVLAMGPRFYGPDVDEMALMIMMVFFTGKNNETI
jgi:hypothetical protein